MEEAIKDLQNFKATLFKTFEDLLHSNWIAATFLKLFVYK